MQIVSIEDNLQECQILYPGKKILYEKYFKMSAENFTQSAML